MQAIKYIAHPLAGAPHATEIVLGAAVKLAAIVGKEGFAEAVECQQRRAKVVGDQVAESFELSVDRSERGGPLLDQVLELVSIAAQLLLRPIQLHKNSDLGPKDRRHNWRKDEIHSAKLIPTPRVGLALVERCHEDDRRQLGLRPLPDELGGLEPVHVRHSDIQENDGELLAQELAQSVGARRGLDHFLAEMNEDGLEGKALGRVVVDHQDSDRRLGSAIGRLCRALNCGHRTLWNRLMSPRTCSYRLLFGQKTSDSFWPSARYPDLIRLS